MYANVQNAMRGVPYNSPITAVATAAAAAAEMEAEMEAHGGGLPASSGEEGSVEVFKRTAKRSAEVILRNHLRLEPIEGTPKYKVLELMEEVNDEPTLQGTLLEYRSRKDEADKLSYKTDKPALRQIILDHIGLWYNYKKNLKPPWIVQHGTAFIDSVSEKNVDADSHVQPMPEEEATPEGTAEVPPRYCHLACDTRLPTKEFGMKVVFRTGEESKGGGQSTHPS